jgi:hypothetical protein
MQQYTGASLATRPKDLNPESTVNYRTWYGSRYSIPSLNKWLNIFN